MTIKFQRSLKSMKFKTQFWSCPGHRKDHFLYWRKTIWGDGSERAGHGYRNLWKKSLGKEKDFFPKSLKERWPLTKRIENQELSEIGRYRKDTK